MDSAGLMVFAVALFVAAASPGPAIAALVARVLVRGSAGALAFMAGLAIGDVVWLTSAILGLAFMARSFAFAFLVVKYAGAAYLLDLAWRMWTAPAHPPAAEAPRAENPLRLFAA
jgi:threonine/homoserine/homoserine lactone efflux protein